MECVFLRLSDLKIGRAQLHCLLHDMGCNYKCVDSYLMANALLTSIPYSRVQIPFPVRRRVNG